MRFEAASSARLASRELTTTAAPSCANAVAIAWPMPPLEPVPTATFPCKRREGADVAQRPLINPLRQEFFGEHRPASTLVEVSRLVRDDLLLEIEAIAELPD